MFIRTSVLALLAVSALHAQTPLRLAIGGLEHGHADGFLARVLKRTDVKLVGISEPDSAVRESYKNKFQIDSSLLFSSTAEMLDKTKPEAVALFTSTYGHVAGVEECARRGIPVMMEKPLAVSVEAAHSIERAARQGHIPVIVNYETTWYRSNREAWAMRDKIGGIRKVVVHDGHQGPKEINVQPEFLRWLTDPEKNGAGALFDFGCYGADLMTWLMNGERPLTVTAVTQQIKPEIYSKVDDEGTIVLTYPRAQAIIQASWNWPFDRKDMEVYGRTGYVITVAKDAVRLRLAGQAEERVDAPPLAAPYDDSLNYLAAVARRELQPSGLSALDTNVIVTEILEAARTSASTGKAVELAAKGIQKDIEYGRPGGKPLLLDARIPEGTGPFPAAILVHGGGFDAGSKSTNVRPLFDILSHAGFAWFSVDYRMAPEFRFPQAMDDIYSAIRWVKANAAKYRVDPAKIVIIGESAGGLLVNYAGTHDMPGTKVAAVVDIYGTVDYGQLAEARRDHPERFDMQTINGHAANGGGIHFFGVNTLDENGLAKLRAVSPIGGVHPGMPPFLCIHGTKDDQVSFEQSPEMCEAMYKVGAQCDLITIDGGGHGMGSWREPEMQHWKAEMIEWLQKTLGAR